MTEIGPLLDEARRGTVSAQAELYRQFRPRVVRLARAFAELDRDEVEDVVQETFIRAFQALPRLLEVTAFGPWLLTIARNRARSRVERVGALAGGLRRFAVETPSDVPDFPIALQAERDEQVVRDVIEELAEGPEKETVRLFYVEGQLSAREIADRLGVGKSTVTMRLERFRGRVKRVLLRRVLAVRRG